MGYCENSREVKLYGAVEQVVKENEGDRRFPVATGILSSKPNATFKNYN